MVSRFLIRLGEFFIQYYNDSKRINSPSQEGAFYTLKSLGWQPKTCIDVGAYHGKWTHMFHSIFPDSKVLMIEGQKGKEPHLKNALSKSPNDISYEIALLGATDDVEVDFIEMETGSSVFEEASSYDRTRTKRKLTKLDTLLERHPKFQEANVIKLDTQGYELEVLKGATLFLPIPR